MRELLRVKSSFRHQRRTELESRHYRGMNKIDRKLLGLVALFVLSFIIFVSSVVFRDQLGVFTRASADTTPSGTETKIFAWPLDLKVGEQSKISVFVVSTNGHKVSNQRVKLNSSLGTVTPSELVSNDIGESDFVLQSDTPGTAIITAVINDSTNVTQQVSIVFR